jgi:hypothetical protein
MRRTNTMGTHYREHIIDPRAYERADGNGWTAEVYVFRKSSNKDTQFNLVGTFESREKAIEDALAVGKKKVDEGYDDSIEVQDTQGG